MIGLIENIVSSYSRFDEIDILTLTQAEKGLDVLVRGIGNILLVSYITFILFSVISLPQLTH